MTICNNPSVVFVNMIGQISVATDNFSLYPISFVNKVLHCPMAIKSIALCGGLIPLSLTSVVVELKMVFSEGCVVSLAHFL